MSLDSLGDVGVVGVCVLLILREIFSYLRSRDAAGGADAGVECEDAAEKLATMEAQMGSLASSCSDMSSIMSRVDSDGLPLVYTPRSLVRAIQDLSSTVATLASRFPDRSDRP